MALVARGADYGIRTRAYAGLTVVGLGARVGVVARRAVRPNWIRAEAGNGVARAYVMALIARGAGYGIRTGTDSGLTGIRLGARVGVVARGAVRLVGIRADAGAGVARPGVVTLVAGRTDDRVRTRAYAGLACVGLRA